MADTHFADRTDEVTELERKNDATVRKVIGEATVLLENNGVLPLSKAGKVALFGNAARNTIKGGTGSGCVNSRYIINIEKGLENEGFTVTSKQWLDEYDAHFKEVKKQYLLDIQKWIDEEKVSIILAQMDRPLVEKTIPLITDAHIKDADTDVAIYAIGRISGEGADRLEKPGDYLLNECEIKNLTFLGQHFKKVIVLLNIGGVIDIKQITSIPGIGAILYISQCGNQTGSIVADVLLGKSSPSGKLSTTWAMNYIDYPFASEFSHLKGS